MRRRVFTRPGARLGAWQAGGRENGYALMVVMLAMALMVLMLAEAVPSWRTEIQREHEAQMIDRAREYRMAIRRYFHKNGRYPPDLDAMTQRDGFGLRYLREKWPDPLNPKDDGAWQFIHYGQAVTKEIVDQPPQAAQSAVGGVSSPGLAGPGLVGSTGTPGLTGGATPGLGGATAPGLAGATAPGFAGAGQGAIPGLPSSTSAGGGDAVSGANSGAASAGPIIGVASTSKEPAVHEFNGFDTPDHWQFVYNFATDPSLRATPGMGGLPGTTTPGSVGQTPGTPGMTTSPTSPTPTGTPLGGGSGSTGNPPGGCCNN